MNDLLFVYGTLMRPFYSGITRLLRKNSTFIGEGLVHGRLYDLGSYPGLVCDPNEKNTVKGEILRLHYPEVFLAVLDEYEMIDPATPEKNEYLRTIIPVKSEENLECWVYVYQFDTHNFPLIPSGNYLSYFFQNPNPNHQQFIDKN